MVEPVPVDPTATEQVQQFDLEGHHFTCTMPRSSQDEQCWTIVVTKDGQEIRRETVPMLHPPIFGPDICDVATRDERVEQIILELGL